MKLPLVDWQGWFCYNCSSEIRGRGEKWRNDTISISDQKNDRKQNKQKSMSKTLKRCDKRMTELDEQVAKLESEDGSFLEDAMYLLELAKRAAE